MDKQALLAEDLEQDVITLPRGSVTVRALSRHEVAEIQEKTSSQLEGEAWMIHFGVLDPVLTVDEAKQWQKNSRNGETDYVTDRIGQLSGLNKAVNKEYYKSLGQQSEPGVGALHRGEAGVEVDSGTPPGDVER